MPIALRILFLALLLLPAIVFLWQNLTPSIALIFLGTKLPELPLSVWILGAFSIGVLISVLFSILFYWASRPGKPSRKMSGETTEPWDDTNWGDRSAKVNASNEGWTDRPTNQPKPPKKVVDAEFRVITPPMRNLDEEDG